MLIEKHAFTYEQVAVQISEDAVVVAQGGIDSERDKSYWLHQFITVTCEEYMNRHEKVTITLSRKAAFNLWVALERAEKEIQAKTASCPARMLHVAVFECSCETAHDVVPNHLWRCVNHGAPLVRHYEKPA